MPAGRAQDPTSATQPGDRGPLTVGRLLSFGILAWALGVILAIIEEAGGLSRDSAITVLLLVGGTAFLGGLVLLKRQVGPSVKHILVEAEIRDPLTGLPNERYLLLRLEEEIARAHRYERPLTLAILDINSLAAVNEQYGRDCGDDVVRHVAAVVQETKRATDILARMRDDEFAVVLAECSVEGGQAFVSRLTERLAREPLPTLLENRPSHIWVGVCVGLAETESEEETPAALLDRARAGLTGARDERDHRRERWRAA
jgi:diguanylate cyclase (GGDEF)-like protein